MGNKEQGKQDMQFWLNGPEFLWKEYQSWPEQPIDLPDIEDMDREVNKNQSGRWGCPSFGRSSSRVLNSSYLSPVLLVSIVKVRSMAIEIQAIYIIPLWKGSSSVCTM